MMVAHIITLHPLIDSNTQEGGLQTGYNATVDQEEVLLVVGGGGRR